ncbi:MAG: multiheme c-type cytochrome [Phycisphaerales bacterium]|nr:multiheme c-type cytochrome [Phycisphaerales bacterium]
MPLPTTAEDFYQPGTQPLPTQPGTDPPMQMQEFEIAPFSCAGCHLFEDDNNPDIQTGPMNLWAASMMAQSVRDPIWQAAVTIANQDADFSGEYCMRCHTPTGWGSGRSTNGVLEDLLDPDDYDGVNCNFCHRMVDPIASEENPTEDELILQDLIDAGTYPDPDQPGNGRFIFDPVDTRRGPLDDVLYNMHGASEIKVSPFHLDSAQCAACHDLSNPAFERQEDGTYLLTDFDTAHPTQNTYDMMPEQRTYSEWLASKFADGGVQFDDGRFGGEHPTGLMQSCQDCHMPKASGANCAFWYLPDVGHRKSLSLHHFTGANSWVLGAVKELYEPQHTSLTEQSVSDAKDRTVALMQAASDMDVTQEDAILNIRITNWSGHKLPTGYPEGRRMWVNVKFYDDSDTLIEEIGEYDYTTAELDVEGTKIYEMLRGIDANVAAATGLPEGETLHLVLANEILKDNRIPPVGFTNAGFEGIRAAPVNYTYADDQHWDDTAASIPAGATKAVVGLLHQTTTKEYIEFLRDNNHTDLKGQIAYDAWVDHGKSAPVTMDLVEIDLEIPEGDGDTCDSPLIASLGSNSFDTSDATDSGFGNPDELQCPDSYLDWGSSPDRWFSWQPLDNGTASFNTCDSTSYDTSLVIYEGSECSSLTQLACNGDATGDSGCQQFYSSITDLAITGGSTYYIRLGGWQAATGPGTLNIDYEATANPADLDMDGDVDVDDILLLLADFGCTGSCTGDVNDDGVVDVTDLLELLAAWSA